MLETAGGESRQSGSMQVFPYTEQMGERWDEAVARCPMATFLHTRRYLSYHGDRFADVSMLLMDQNQRIVGLFPAAVDPTEARRVVSHPGITFGGLLHGGELSGERAVEALEFLRGYYADLGFESLRYKVVPYVYHQTPSSDDLYALFRLGAVRYRCDLSCAVDLENRPPLSARRRRSLKRAKKEGVEVREGVEFIEPLWRVLEENLNRKHGVKPVHTAEEIRHLQFLFPDNIRFVAALIDEEVVAGVTLFATGRVMHAQYIASSPAGNEVSALDAVFEDCIERAKALGVRYFDFGISNEEEGRYLNAGLYQFKSEFGAGGVVHEFYDLQLGS